MTTTSSNSNFSSPVNVRLSHEKHFLYQSHAVTLGKSYSTYLRERLESQDILYDELRAVHHKIDTLFLEKSSDKTSVFDQGILIEILLLLRTIANPGDRRMVYSELERQGLCVWNGLQGQGL